MLCKKKNHFFALFTHPKNDVAALNTMKPFGGRVCLTLCKIALMILLLAPMITVTSSPRTWWQAWQLLWFHLSNSSSGLDVEKMCNGVV